jgi:hypothetical protein
VDDLDALPPLPTLASTDIEKRIADAISRPTKEDDTYPGPSDRFRLVRDVSYNGGQPDSTPVWDLFAANDSAGVALDVRGDFRVFLYPPEQITRHRATARYLLRATAGGA